jgi:hypothetical protein
LPRYWCGNFMLAEVYHKESFRVDFLLLCLHAEPDAIKLHH